MKKGQPSGKSSKHAPQRYGTATVRPAKLEPDLRHEPMEASQATAFDSPVSVRVHCLRKRVIDLDNISIKAVLDGIVACGLLRDDSPEFIRAIQVTQEKASYEETIITITETE